MSNMSLEGTVRIPNPRELTQTARLIAAHEREFSEARQAEQAEAAIEGDVVHFVRTQLVPRIVRATDRGEYFCNILTSQCSIGSSRDSHAVYKGVLAYCEQHYNSGEYKVGEFSYNWDYDGMNMLASAIQIRWDDQPIHEEWAKR